MAYYQQNDSGVLSSPESNNPNYYHHNSPDLSTNRAPRNPATPNTRIERAPELVYTSSNYDNEQPDPNHRPHSRTSSVASFASNVSLYEDHFNDLRLAAKLGKILLDRTRKLELELDVTRRDVAARDKEVKWLRENQASKSRFHEEQGESMQFLQNTTKELRIELSERSAELERTKGHLNFQEQRTGDLESQLRKELQWRGYYTTSQADLPMHEGGTLPPSIAPIHQKMRRHLSDGDLSRSAAPSERRHISAEAAFSQSRMDAEIEEMQIQHLEEIAAKNYEIQQLEILLDESKSLLAHTEHREEQLEQEKQALILQVQEHAVLQSLESSVQYENELESIDAKKQQQYEVLTGKFEKILESIEVEKQRTGIMSETASQLGLTKSDSFRMPVENGHIPAPPMLNRYLSVQVKKEAHIDASNYGSKRRPKHTHQQPLESNHAEPGRPEYAFDRDYSTLTVVDMSEPAAVQPVLNELNRKDEDDELFHQSVSQESDPDSDDDFNSTVEQLNTGGTGLSEECSMEEPEYKKLFQELFELIHTVIPENEQWVFD